MENCSGCGKTMNATYQRGRKNKRFCLMCITHLEKCNKCGDFEFMQADDDPSRFICADCIANEEYERMYGQYDDGKDIPDTVEEVLEAWKTNKKPLPTMYEKITEFNSAFQPIGKVKFERAISNYMANNPTKDPQAHKAFNYLRKTSGVGAETKVIELIRTLSTVSGESSIKIVAKLAHRNDVGIAIDAVIAQNRHHGFLCYDYKRADKKSAAEGMTTSLYADYVARGVEAILCQEHQDDTMTDNTMRYMCM